MDKYETRRLKVLELIKNRCDGVHAKFADKIERSPSYVGRMLYPRGKDGKKNISDTLIDVIEEKFGLPRGWLDSSDRIESEPAPRLTKEQEKVLELVDQIDSDALKAWLDIGLLLSQRRLRGPRLIKNHGISSGRMIKNRKSQNRRVGDEEPV